MKKFTTWILQRKLPMVLAASGFAVAVQAAEVQPPPRPPGSNTVLVEAGMDPREVSRQKGAHQHSRLEKKDFTRDDTRDTHRPDGNHVQMFIVHDGTHDAHPDPQRLGKSKDQKPTPRSK